MTHANNQIPLVLGSIVIVMLPTAGIYIGLALFATLPPDTTGEIVLQ